MNIKLFVPIYCNVYRNILLVPLGQLFSVVDFQMKKNFVEGYQMKIPIQIWFRLSQWFKKRRSKCKSLWMRMMTATAAN